MIIAGLRCTKDTLDWVVLSATSRLDGIVVEQRKVRAPAGAPGARLMWVRSEVLELLDRHEVGIFSLRVNETGGQGISLERSEIEGVVQEAVYSRGIECLRLKGASLRSKYKAKTRSELDAKTQQIPLIEGMAASRREPLICALAPLD